ncbi:MAG: NADH dehydrogenase, subunit 5 [uncultured Sulfurovum sp.]|uniref:NADH dehydrogenase, subunit 5 n=1 Tax=uncultured Sulfurovum sp. TaxID=269237 RepID=A0A6S6U519_9BACT|nr:MAG: NADH dehydrogenase, subunit 5 [uncultured Sulfurovum sp.]
MEKLVLFIPFIPIMIALLIGFLDKKILMPKVSIFFSSGVALLALYGTYYVMSTDQVIEGFGGLLVFNELSAILVPYVAILGLVIRKYSTKYMWDEPGYKRFFVLLNFIFSAIYLLVMSNNLIILTIAWQLMSISLYLLITFNVQSKSAIKNGGWTMIIHKLADLLFIIAVILTYKVFGSFDLTQLSQTWLEMAKSGPVDNPLIYVIGFLFLFAAMMKSAIMPFHLWLPYTSEAPTPVSALMHAGVVNVGGILLNKMAFLLLLTPSVLNVAFIMGLITAIFASILMLAVSDIKRSLGYSTVGQMGYMIMEVGLGAFSLAIYHLMVHGIFKASLFLESGSLINSARKDPNVPKRLSHELFWEEKPQYNSINMFRMIALFTVLPVIVFMGVKFLLGEDVFHFNAAILILAFAWLTGTQLFLSFFEVNKVNSPKVILGLISSFIIVLFTYEFVGLSLEHFLYGENGVLFYESATIHVTGTMTLLMLGAIMIIGWYFTYRQHFVGIPIGKHQPSKSKWRIYKILAKEGYLSDLYIKYFKIF